VLSAQKDERIGKYLDKLASRMGKAKALSALAHKLGRAFYHTLPKKEVFNLIVPGQGVFGNNISSSLRWPALRCASWLTTHNCIASTLRGRRSYPTVPHVHIVG